MSKGFKCIPIKTTNGTIYQFIANHELENYVNNNFSVRDFFINKNLLF